MIMHASLINRAFKNPRRFSRIGAVVLFYLGLIILLITLLDTDPMVQNTASVKKATNQRQAVVDSQLHQMLAWPLFGQGASPLHQIKDSSLQLVGIIFDGNESIAIIRVNGVEQMLKNKGKINENYTIAKIEPMRVIVSTEEGYKQLQLFERSDKPKHNFEHGGKLNQNFERGDMINQTFESDG